ncbi:MULTISPECIES: mechanosensitive ion channel family protein [Idiomarina]|jgi:miniconductance mechanosensitive channel|uniref:Mechanosensitive ion channel family protein n=2 Tax=Idiomarina abyssalis TaxID=86102 RepID=A0A8I1KHP1_9GAMM|nr:MULTISPECIES: mechanosensitive ion channel family protein [Idiomarina]KPD22019.1 mechanosensitive ion channel protein MscS [Idiomarina abyssalis]MAB22623.1 mechanosensitive ion channel family protein [Idiomarina sp.]MAL83609.1 mechanosensitive ion channel family protein [Idiomarina sp.]MAO68479.1 mechanosensitive ion channel family protein [Idiomarina sp.]MBF80876.1 mechanosensitive ion channel family protein [Idiomarina sp.]|tara:strand:+ start:2473 stop:3708 length:1236 start_codon:yes stop_codon:yes gene_type:complete
MDFEFIKEWLQKFGIDSNLQELSLVISSLLVLIGCYIAYALARWIIDHAIDRLLSKAPERWYKALVNSGFFKRCANLAPIVVIHSFIPILFIDDFESWQSPLRTVVGVYLTWVITSILTALANVISIAYDYTYKAREVPITGVIQVAKLVLVLMAIIITIAIIMNKSPMYLLSGFGAMTAILMVVFRDTLMGFVAGVQLATNRMVAIGDWIELTDHGVDGTVQEVGLISVKVENWDKTIVYLPTYVLIHESFKNWQGMVNTGGRRMRRSLMIDLDSSKILSDEQLDELAKKHFKQSAEDWLEANELEKPVSNLTVFRVFTDNYLRNHKQVREDLTLMARLMQPTAAGIPLEIYAFCKQIDWMKYEAVQSSIVEYLYSVMPDFGLKNYQFLNNNQAFSQNGEGAYCQYKPES